MRKRRIGIGNVVGLAKTLGFGLVSEVLRLLPTMKRVGAVEEMYDAVAKTVEGDTLMTLRRQCLSRVFQGVQGGDDPVETWRTRKYAFDRYLDRFMLLSSIDVGRIYGFISLLEELRNVRGDVVECGVGYAKSLTTLVFGVAVLRLDRTVYGFDSFMGFPKASIHDLGPRVPGVGVPTGWTNTSVKVIQMIFRTDESREDSLLREHHVKVELVSGFFSDTLAARLPEKIAFLHVDCDLYESTRMVLEECLPRMSPGGLVVFDECRERNWPGATIAIDEVCKARGLQLAHFPYIRRYGLRL